MRNILFITVIFTSWLQVSAMEMSGMIWITASAREVSIVLDAMPEYGEDIAAKIISEHDGYIIFNNTI